MGLNRPFDRSFFVMNGAVKTTGGSFHLAKGELGFFDQTKTTPTGIKAVTNFAGKPKNAKDFVIRCGIQAKEPNRTYSNKDESSMPFSLQEVKELRVSAPKQTEQIVDDVILGYDGITPGSGFTFQTGDAYFQIALELSGDYISYLGGGLDKEIVIVRMEVPHCDPFNTCEDCDNCDAIDCKAITMDAIERLRRHQLSGGKTVEEVVDITPIFECDNDVTATLIPYDYYTLELCDTGTDGALALVQAQYDLPVIRIDRRGSTSVYQVLLPQADGAPADFEQTIASIIKDCDACPAGYTEVDGGLLYAFTIEDDGSDQSALITALTGYVTGTVVKSGNNAGVGYYTAVFSAKITDAAIATFLAAGAPRNTATIDLVGEIADICEDTTVTTTAWVLGDTCNAVEQTYQITLPDDECGNNRLAELQGAYPDLTITLADSDSSTQSITLTGTSGTANISVGGTLYLATFATSLTVTAANFVTAHAAAILADTGATVTSNGAVLTFTDLTASFPALVAPANVSGNLAGTLGTLAAIPAAAACQSIYETTVISNLVCEECDPVFNDFYVTQAPEMYDLTQWVLIADTTTSPSGNCQCGIRFRGKTFVIAGEESLRDITGFVETSTMIRVSAGYPEEIREGIGRLPVGAFEGKYLSHYVPRTHLGGNLRDLENESRAYFRGLDYRKDYLGRLLRGETSNIEDQLAQYVQYTVVVSHFNHTQGFAGRINEDINYHIYVEVGRHQAIETILNNLAANAGVTGVQAFGA